MDTALQRPVASMTSASLPSEESVTGPSDEPPDSGYPHSLPTPIAVRGAGNRIQGFKIEQDRRYVGEASTSPTVPYSPYMADSTGGSASDYEHELDSPSSLSSWNSWAGGRRGDLADVEELELDEGAGGEPELETVSELDEESSSFCSGSDRTGLDSDEESTRHQKMGLLGLGFDTSSPRRKNIRVGGQFNDVSHSHHVHHASNQHHYHHSSGHNQHHNLNAPPSFPHFSPRAGGHGLSHSSRYSLRAPPNLAARRRKGRIAELAEEGAGEPINTTVMPKRSATKHRAGKEVVGKDQDAENTVGGDTTADEEDIHPSQTETEVEEDGEGDNRSPSTPTLHSSSNVWNEFEFVGPPPIPPRCVSPSETVPVVPSPLCVCLNAEEQGVNSEEKAVTTETLGATSSSIPGGEDDVTIRVEDAPVLVILDRPCSPPSPTTSGKSVESFPTTVSTPPTSPPGSPQLVRKSSRGRRSSSPGRAKPKVPLRPCFRRRGSAQVGVLKQPESSSECESNGEGSSLRGRVKVRFSEAPPTEVRTHSPVEYDRKACPISNRLSTSDVEELRGMKMEMGLLEAKWAAMAACKTDANTEDEESEGENFYPRNPSHLMRTPPNPPPPVGERKRADSISSSSPSRFCKNRFASRDPSSISPADHLRMEREKERERACRLAGIGTGIGFRYTGSGGTSPRQLHHGGSKTPGACNPTSLISRFGLSKPPPPLPGTLSPTKPSFEGGSSLYRPSSAPPIRNDYYDPSPSYPSVQREEEDFRGRTMDKATSRNLDNSTSTDGTVTESSRSTSKSIPELIHTSPSPHSSPDRSSNRSSPPPPLHLQQQSDKAIRPSIQPYQLPPIDKNTTTPSHSPPSSVPYSSSLCGYDSPASEFYESGSEYDLIG